jgi:hypothetical protein
MKQRWTLATITNKLLMRMISIARRDVFPVHALE